MFLVCCLWKKNKKLYECKLVNLIMPIDYYVLEKYKEFFWSIPTFFFQIEFHWLKLEIQDLG